MRNKAKVKKAPAKPDSPARRPPYLQIALLCLVSAAVYVNTLANGFVFDDNFQVLRNLWIRDFASLPEVFGNNVWAFRGSSSNYYRPMMHVIYMFGYHLLGPVPWGFHLINMLLNTGVCVLVFAVTGRLLKDSGAEGPGAAYIPLAVSVIFAVHPVHTEAVAWIAGVPDISFAFFYLLSFYYYMVSRGTGGRPGLSAAISVASFFVAMLCKEPAVTLPGVLFGYDYVVKKGRGGLAGYLKRYLPYAVALAVYFALRLTALGGFTPHPASWKLGPYQVAINMPPLFSRYLEKMLLPVDLNIYHPFHPVSTLADPAALIRTVVAIAFLAALVILLKRRNAAAVALLFIIMPLLPSHYIPAVGKNVFCERYLYLPVFGFALLAGQLFMRITAGRPSSGKALVVFTALLAVVYSAGTIQANKVWADDITLWTHSVKLTPDNSAAHGSLGEAYFKKGMIDRAMVEYNTVIALDKESLITHLDLAGAYVVKGMLDKALEKTNYVLSRAGNDLYLVALSHSNLGAIYTKEGQLDRAVEEFDKALSFDPMLPDAHSNLGAVYGMRGQTEEALAHCLAAVEMSPDYLEFHNNLGIIYSMMGRNDEALGEFYHVLDKNPLYPKAHNNIGITYARMGRMDMAVREFEEALKIDPDDALLRDNLRRAREPGAPPHQGG